MHTTWRNQSDVMDDIWALSEMEGIGSHEIEEPPPATILEYRAQMEANNTGSIYDTPAFDDQGVTYVMSGRGRGGYSTILRPGISNFSDNLVVEEVQRKIRQVSGLGYSNALIEQGVRARAEANDNKKTSPVNQSPSSSKTSSPYKTSGIRSPTNKERCSSTSSLNSGFPVTENGGPPPPLSVMRKKAQEERVRKKDTALEEVSTKKSEGSRDKKTPQSPSNGLRSPWRGSSPGTSSDEGSWRTRNGNTANRFFKQRFNGFSLNCNDFPVLK